MKIKLILFFIFLFNYINALKIDRVILATDSNPNYIEFWPIVAKAWKEIIGIKPTLALIATKETKIDRSLGDVIRFDPIEGVSTALQAQTIRLLLPAYYINENCLISDIDLIPLNKSYFLDSVANLADDCLILYRDAAYRDIEPDKYPMMFVAGKGKTFKDIFQINNIHDIPNIIKKWSDLKLGWYTDELQLFKYLNNWKDYKTRCVKLGHYVERRIDRSYFAYDIEQLKNKFYFDMHCPRPYSKYKNEIDTIVNTVINPKTNKKNIIYNKRIIENADYGSHMAALLTVMMNTDGPVLEMGSGDFSTPLLHALCRPTKRYLLTAETDKKWVNNFIDLKTDWHDIQYVPVFEDDWSLNPKPNMWDQIGTTKHWSVVLIDHRPGERRAEDTSRLRKNTDIFVVHDTQQPTYNYEPVISTFKYKYVYPRYFTQTTIISDTIDVSQFFDE